MLITDKVPSNQTQTKRVQAVRAQLSSGLKIVHTPYTPHFKIVGNTIQCLEQFNPYYTQLMIDQTIPQTGVFSFKIKILHSYNKLHSSIFIGIINPDEYKNARTSHYQKNVFTYFGKKAMLFPGRIEQGRGFSQSDVIEVRLTRSQNLIEYFVNDKLQASKRNQILSTLKCVPFVQMNEPSDKILWLGSQTK